MFVYVWVCNRLPFVWSSPIAEKKTFTHISHNIWGEIIESKKTTFPHHSFYYSWKAFIYSINQLIDRSIDYCETWLDEYFSFHWIQYINEMKKKYSQKQTSRVLVSVCVCVCVLCSPVFLLFCLSLITRTDYWNIKLQ